MAQATKSIIGGSSQPQRKDYKVARATTNEILYKWLKPHNEFIIIIKCLEPQ